MNKNILLVMIIGIFLAGNIAAAEWDNVKDYDPNTRTATVTNLFGFGDVIGEVKLLTPLNVQVPAGYQKVAEFQVKSYQNYEDALSKISFYDKKEDLKEITRTFDFKYKTVEVVEVPDYESVCNEISSKENNYNKCSKKQIGSHKEEREVWTDMTKDLLDDQVLTVGVFTYVLPNDYIEWIPNFFGVDIQEWATWTASLNSGLVVYYNFEEGSGAVVDDEITHNRNGTASNSSGWGSGIIGNAINLDGADDTVNITNYNGVSGFADSSISFWIYPRLNYTTVQYYWDNSPPRQYFLMQNPNWDLHWGNNEQTFSSTPMDNAGWFTLNAWHHIVLIYDSSGAGNQFWADGVSRVNSSDIWTPTNTSWMVIGSRYNGVSYLNSKIDEFGIWNRQLTGEEVIQLYNGGTGITYDANPTPPDQPPIVTAISPANATTYTTSPLIVNLTCYGSDDLNFSEMDLYLNSSLTFTNTSGLNNTNYTFSKSLIDGAYNWSCIGYDNATQSASTTARYFTIDSIAPLFTVYSPTDPQLSYNLPVNVSLNVTTTDLNLASCWYFTSDSASNITYTCNALANVLFATGGNKVIYVWANDTLGNYNSTSISFLLNYLTPSVNYTTPIIEGDPNRIYFNVSASSISSISANLTYNSSTYTMGVYSSNSTNAILYKDLTAPLVYAETTQQFYITYDINGGTNTTSNYTQSVYNIPSLVVQNTTCSDMALNFTLKDEETLTDLNGQFDYNFYYGTSTNNTFIRSFGTINNTNVLYVCINSTISNAWKLGEGSIFYNTPTHVDRRYYLFTNMTLSNSLTNITLYDLLSADQTSFKLEVEDTSLNPYVEKYTTLVRWYPALNEYNVVDMGLTDETGSTVIHVRTEDVDYRIGVYERNGTLIKLANPIRMVCLVSPCTYTLRISPSDIDYTSFLNVDYTFDFNETTGMWTFIFSDSSQLTTEMNLTVYRITGTSIYPVCSSAVSGFSGAVTCNTSIYTGTLQGVVQRMASPPVPIAQKIVTIGTTAFSSTFGLWLSMILAIPIIFIFAFMTPVGAIIGGIIALIPAFYFGSISIAILGGIAVLGGIVLHFLKRIG